MKFRAELRLLADDAPALGLSELGHGRKIPSVCDSELMATWCSKCKTSHSENCPRPRIADEDLPESREGDAGAKAQAAA